MEIREEDKPRIVVKIHWSGCRQAMTHPLANKAPPGILDDAGEGSPGQSGRESVTNKSHIILSSQHDIPQKKNFSGENS